jgi:ABC-type Fe3+ transport system substrate-binding protein
VTSGLLFPFVTRTWAAIVAGLALLAAGVAAEAAKAFLKFISTPAAGTAYKSKGLDPT